MKTRNSRNREGREGKQENTCTIELLSDLNQPNQLKLMDNSTIQNVKDLTIKKETLFSLDWNTHL
jgi:hypothetical protein